MIQITTDQFEQLLPFVGAATEDVFLRMQPDFEMRYTSLLEQVVSPDFEAKAATQAYSPLSGYVRDYVILSTFIDRLHSQDIIMTDNGFGVVSNENIAPASQARVDALKAELTYKRDLRLHSIINGMRRFEGWSETDQAISAIGSFVWSPVILGQSCGVPGYLTFDDLRKRRAEITAAENLLRQHLSDGLIDQLIAEERKYKFAQSHRAAKFKILGFIGASFKRGDDSIDHGQQALGFENVLRFIEGHIDDFALYRDSTAYKANHMQDYENKADDTTFFFAG